MGPTAFSKRCHTAQSCQEQRRSALDSMSGMFPSGRMSIIHVMFTSFPPKGHPIHDRWQFEGGRSRIMSNRNKNGNQYQMTDWTWQCYVMRKFIVTMNGCDTRRNDLQEINGEESNLDVSEDATPIDKAEDGRRGRQPRFL